MRRSFKLWLRRRWVEIQSSNFKAVAVGWAVPTTLEAWLFAWMFLEFHSFIDSSTPKTSLCKFRLDRFG